METMFDESINTENLISIIVPVYNVDSYIANCLDSILNQTYKKIEIIAVDDGSQDQSGLILDNYENKYPSKIRVIHTENRGVTNARLAGVEAANGVWIGFVDGDDEIEPDMYERLINNALKYDADISHCGYQTIVNGGERIHYFYNTGTIRRQDRLTALRDLLQGTIIEPGLWNKLYKRSLFEYCLIDNSVDRSIRFFEDLLMNFFLFSDSSSSVYEDFCPYHYMVRNTSVTRNQFRSYKVLDPIKVEKTILDHVDISLKDLAWRRYLERCVRAYNTLYRANPNQSILSEIKKNIVENRQKWSILPFKSLCKLLLVIYLPDQYMKVKRLYSKFKGNSKKYE